MVHWGNTERVHSSKLQCWESQWRIGSSSASCAWRCWRRVVNYRWVRQTQARRIKHLQCDIWAFEFNKCYTSWIRLRSDFSFAGKNPDRKEVADTNYTFHLVNRIHILGWLEVLELKTGKNVQLLRISTATHFIWAIWGTTVLFIDYIPFSNRRKKSSIFFFKSSIIVIPMSLSSNSRWFMHVSKMILCLVTATIEDETVWPRRSFVLLCVLFHSFLNKGIGLNTSAFHKLDSTAARNMGKP